MTIFNNLSQTDLWNYRCGIDISSIIISDFTNPFGITEKSMCTFFNGYLEYLWELAEEKHLEPTYGDILEFDNSETLYDWYNCYGDFTWV
jgi:hypothetical protein